MTDVVLRPRREEDLEPLVVVAQRVEAADGYPIHLPDRNFARFLTRPKAAQAWVAVLDGEVVGHVALAEETSPPVMELVASVLPERTVRYVARLLVDPAARGRGIGTSLLERARDTAVTGGHLPVLDVVETPSAGAAISIYRGTGWTEVGRVPFELAPTELDEVVFRWGSV